MDKCNLEEILKDLPSKWRDAIIKVLLEFEETEPLSCEDVKDCETLTSLSEFSQEGSEICITYKDEDGVEVERCFDIENVINDTLDDVDPSCITTPTLWNQMSLSEKFQALIDTVCNCCPSTTTTTTSTTTTTTTP